MATPKLIRQVVIMEDGGRTHTKLCTTLLDGTVPPWQRVADRAGFRFAESDVDRDDVNVFFGRTDQVVLTLVHREDGERIQVRFTGRGFERVGQ